MVFVPEVLVRLDVLVKSLQFFYTLLVVSNVLVTERLLLAGVGANNKVDGAIIETVLVEFRASLVIEHAVLQGKQAVKFVCNEYSRVRGRHVNSVNRKSRRRECTSSLI